MGTYDLLEKLLKLIEENIQNNLCINELALKLYISPVHLQRLFKCAFNIPMAGYIRSRRLSSSLERLLKSDLTILDIATEYDFKFEQSYIRAFKREFGQTPADVRKNRSIIKITPPIHLFLSSKLSEGVLFGPEIVMIPKFHLTGKLHIIPFNSSVELPQKAAVDFWKSSHHLVNKPVEPDVYYGLTRIRENDDFSHYLTAVQVNDFKDIPPGFETDTFEASLCVRFRYIGNHHYYDINADISKGMYNAITAFTHDTNAKYGIRDNKLYFERIDASACDAAFCIMEWFSPVYEK